MPAPAARIDDPITHTNALNGLIAGALIGGGIALLTVSTGGLAAVAIVGAATVAGAGVGELIGSLSFNTHVTGKVATPGSPDVRINGLRAARAHLDFVACSDHSGPPPVAQGSDSVSINGWPAARVGDRSGCDAEISEGSPNVIVGGGTTTTDEIAPEVPESVHMAMLAVGLASAVVLAGPVAAVLGLAGGMLGGKIAGDIGGDIFGVGSDGQKLMAFGGALLGGGIAGRAGAKGEAWFNSRYEVRTEGLGSNFGNLRLIPKVNGRAPINSQYAGGNFPASKLSAPLQAKYPNGVPFSRNGFPEFPAKAEMRLPPGQRIGSRPEHFRAANEALRVQEEANPGFLRGRGLDQRQIDHIMRNPPLGESPPDLTWHHHETPGRMQLVPRDIHDAVRHTGGHSIWGR